MCLQGQLFLVPRPLRLRWTGGFGYENEMKIIFSPCCPHTRILNDPFTVTLNESVVRWKTVCMAFILNLISLWCCHQSVHCLLKRVPFETVIKSTPKWSKWVIWEQYDYSSYCGRCCQNTTYGSFWPNLLLIWSLGLSPKKITCRQKWCQK